MLGMNGRSVARVIFTPPAKALVKMHVTKDAVTATGAALTCGTALWLYPTGHLMAGSIVLGVLVCADALDGTMARLTGTASQWGAFLDSTLDRVSDAAVFAGLALYFAGVGDYWGTVAGVAALGMGAVVPYARARAEALGYSAAIGIAERSDRLIVALVFAFAVGVGAPRIVLTIALAVIAAASAVTVAQRAHAVWTQSRDAAK